MDIAMGAMPAAAVGAAVDPDRIAVRVLRDVAAAAPHWDRLAATGVGSPFQARGFVEPWFRHLAVTERAEPLIVVGETARGEAFVLPLALGRVGPVRVAGFPGGSHANTNVGLFDPGLWQRLTADDVAAVWTRLSADADVDLVALRAQPARFAGRDNPFAAGWVRPAPHMAYAVDLSGGFEAVLSRHKGGKKRGKVRSRRKALADVGGFTVRRAESCAEAAAILGTFFDQKAARFEQQGIPDVFNCPRTRDFFRDVLAATGPDGTPSTQLWALEIAGGRRATAIALAFAGTVYLVMNSFALDEYARTSPGEVLLYHVIEDCCARGEQVFDFGVGDARYKRSWADHEVALVDTMVPLTAAGTAAALAYDGRRRLRDFVVARPALLKLARRVLRRRAEGEEAGGED